MFGKTKRLHGNFTTQIILLLILTLFHHYLLLLLMNPYALPSLFTSLLNLFLGIFVLWRNPKGRLNLIYFFLCLTFALWGFSEFVYRATANESTALLLTKIEGITWSFFPALFLHFIIVFTKKEKNLKNFLTYCGLYLPSAFFTLLCLVTDLLVAPKVEMKYWGYQEYVGNWFPLFVVYYLIYCIFGLFLCAQFAREAKEKSQKRQAQIIFASVFLSLVGGTITDAIFPLLKIESFISVTHFIFISTVGVAIAIIKKAMPVPAFRSLVFKFGMVTFVLLLLLFVPASIWRYQAVSNLARENLRQDLMCFASIASTFIDVEKHEQILSSEDEDTPLYEEVRQPLKKLVELNPNIDSIYTLRKGPEENIWLFVLDSYDTFDQNQDGIIQPEEERAHVGEEYDVSPYPEMQKAFLGPAADHEINCDKWGCWLSGYAPIKDASGKAVAVVGVDFSAERVKDIERDFKKGALIYMSLVLIPIFVLLLFVVRFFLGPIKHLEKDVQAFAKDVRHRSKLKTSDEFDLVVFQFNKMAERIEGIHKELEKEVKEKTKELEEKYKELERFHKLLVGRELKMAELKKKIAELEEELKKEK